MTGKMNKLMSYWITDVAKAVEEEQAMYNPAEGMQRNILLLHK